ncbi:MAG: hypothetical protein CUN55_01700 [Phototrophicales bacterium]|nr:MAG: hypothetical protein CUN55_01700 [Phototrophicales bacterium]
MEVQQLLADYTQTYQKLYQRYPREVVDLGNGWVLVNGARMTTAELTQLTAQLQKEFEKVRANKRTIVNRLLKWFSTPQVAD